MKRKDTARQTIARIEKYEPMLDACVQGMEQFDAHLEAFAALQKSVQALNAYCGSGEWYADRELYEQGRLPEGIRCGVLGEDSVYDVITANRDAAIRMLELATQILKGL